MLEVAKKVDNIRDTIDADDESDDEDDDDDDDPYKNISQEFIVKESIAPFTIVKSAINDDKSYNRSVQTTLRSIPNEPPPLKQLQDNVVHMMMMWESPSVENKIVSPSIIKSSDYGIIFTQIGLLDDTIPISTKTHKNKVTKNVQYQKDTGTIYDIGTALDIGQRGGFLALGVGFGKTRISLSVVQDTLTRTEDIEWKLDDPQDPPRKTLCTCIVCPPSIIDGWVKEMKKVTYLSYVVLNDFIKTKPTDQDWNFMINTTDVLLVSHSIIHKYVDFYLSYHTFKRIIVDECHNMKNPNTLLARSLYKMKSKYTWLVSATPFPNVIGEVYSYLKMLQVPILQTRSIFTNRDYTKEIRTMILKYIYPLVITDDRIIKSTVSEEAVDMTQRERYTYIKFQVEHIAVTNHLKSSFKRSGGDYRKGLALDYIAMVSNYMQVLGKNETSIYKKKVADIKSKLEKYGTKIKNELDAKNTNEKRKDVLNQQLDILTWIQTKIDACLWYFYDKLNDNRYIQGDLSKHSLCLLDPQFCHDQSSGEYKPDELLNKLMWRKFPDEWSSKLKRVSEILIKIFASNATTSMDNVIITSKFQNSLIVLELFLKVFISDNSIVFGDVQPKIVKFYDGGIKDIKLNEIDPNDPQKEEQYDAGIIYSTTSTKSIKDRKVVNDELRGSYDKSQSNVQRNLIIATTGSIKEGINMEYANHIIIMSPLEYNADYYYQLAGRIERGDAQKKPTFIYRLYTNDTFEKDLLDQQSTKVRLKVIPK
jgi:superfamily II DNA or RNA helicase